MGISPPWRALTVLSLVLVITAIAACEKPPPLEDIPSRVLVEPGPEYRVALDSARQVARRSIGRMYIPGVSIAVGVDGEIIWSEGFGWSDLSQKTPATPMTVYPAGSISKSMTSVAVGVLLERGLLDLDAEVQTYLPDFPEKKGPLSTRLIMGHIAGLQNYGAAVALRWDHCDDITESVPAMQDDTLLWMPGERYRYSNYGFNMVGAIVRVAADEPYLDFMQREVFDAMEMRQTIPDTAQQLPSELGTPYNKRSFETLRHAQPVDMSCAMAAGGFLSTPSDLVRFGFAMLNHEVLEVETVDLLWTALTVNSGYPTGYGLGWSVRPVRLGADEGSTPAVGHGGSTLGGRASLLILPELNMVVTAMTNARGRRVNMSALTGYVASFFRSPESTQ